MKNYLRRGAALLLILSLCSIYTQAQSKKESRNERQEKRRLYFYGTYHFTLINQTTDDSLTFEDSSIKIKFSPDNGIGLSLYNKLDSSISIVWNDASIIMPGGTSEKIIHAGVKYIDEGRAMPNTLIPPKARILDNVVPIDNLVLSSNGWSESSLFKNRPKTKEALDGETISLYLPVLLPSGRKDYNFKLRISIHAPTRGKKNKK